MSLGLAPYFRRFELPWAAGEETERRFLRLLRILLIIATLLAIVVWLLPKPVALIMRDNRFKGKVDNISDAVIGAKRLALSDEEPGKIAEFLGTMIG